MVNCDKCIFCRCCKDAGNIKKCEYYAANATWIKNYLQSNNLWKDEYYNEAYTQNCDYTDNFLGYVLDVLQKENVKMAKEELKYAFGIIGVVVLFIVTALAFAWPDAQWATIYLNILACLSSAALLIFIVRLVWKFFKFVFMNVRTIVRGR